VQPIKFAGQNYLGLFNKSVLYHMKIQFSKYRYLEINGEREYFRGYFRV
jgi:hypothetical protein